MSGNPGLVVGGVVQSGQLGRDIRVERHGCLDYSRSASDEKVRTSIVIGSY
jgi:hypothetical protein